jgi:hypothetical protein
MVQHVLLLVNIHFHLNLSESVGQTLPQLQWKQKRRDLKKIGIPFIKLHETLQEYPP